MRAGGRTPGRARPPPVVRRVGAALLFTGAALVACQGDPSSSAAEAEPDLLPPGADQLIVGMDHYMTREGVRRARVLADTAYVMQDSARMDLRVVDVTFFDANGTEVSALTGDRGLYDLRTHDMEVEGGVVVLDRLRDQRLETEHLLYEAARDELRSEVPFILYRDGGATVMRGEAFVSDPRMDSVLVTRPAGETRSLPPPE